MPTRTLIGQTLHAGPAAGGDDAGVRITLGDDDGSAASDRLARAIEGRIHRGSIGPGARLPTIRALADQLDLAPNTVAKAYRRLEEDGLIEGRGRRGTFVAERLPPPLPDRERRLAEAAEAFVRRGAQLGFAEAELRGALGRALRDS
jgi:DNA-binding transcriptional regulator YhcF (GntR family)